MKLPPLHALMCFEAVARNMSMKKAAEELFVTPGAISQQIAKLEDLIQARLFVRGPRYLELTPQGRIYLSAIRPAFLQIEEATQRLKDEKCNNKLTISCTSGFATQWFLPRLPEFEQLNPGVEVQINTTNRVVDLLSEGVDFAVRHGRGKFPRLESELLLNDHYSVVCSPNLISSVNAITDPRDLLAYTLLHDEHRLDWKIWFTAMGLEDADTDRGPVFVKSNGVIEAVLAAKGIALIRESLIEQELAQGRLLSLISTPNNAGTGYFLVYDESALLTRLGRKFRDWIVAKATLETDRT
ncbi:transcriptional regulator GcvA [Rouxiella sp. WC2420]|uniref:Transcriptional regulator GcvA n=1 Tax=Rouxiella sp. WC2420 TaxID=3234145 RepID=A0AB39VWD6_9GAMM